MENYFLSGILHDIGKILFYRIIPEVYTNVALYAKDNNMSMREAEFSQIGITHLTAGEMLAEKWKLPNQIKNAVRHHYSGMVDGKPDTLVAVVHIANIMASLMTISDCDDFIQEPNRDLWGFLNIPSTFFQDNIASIYADYNETIEYLLKLT